jgi:hypothetical protein|tara:strand:+ start:122 stop:685 length:564 start_codon:yes stop_codon:yes gene_type:complete
MKSPFNFIVRPIEGKRYTNTKTIGGMEFIVNTSEEEHKFSNRQATVVETPVGYKGPIQVGDTLLVHHNVFKFYNDMKGRRQSGKSFFKEDLFFVDNDQFYLYKRDGLWNSHDRFCFVKPIEVLDSFLKKSYKYEPLMGEVVYPNQYLKSNNVFSGDKVCFTPDSEYEFIIDDETLYRVFDHQVTIKL